MDENLIWQIGWKDPVTCSSDRGYTWEYPETFPYGGHIEYAGFTDQERGWAATTELGQYWIIDGGPKTWSMAVDG